MNVRLRLVSAGLALGAVAWLPITSVLLCLALFHDLSSQPNPWLVPFCAFFYWRDFGADRLVHKWLQISAVVSGLICLFPAYVAVRVPVRKRLKPATEGKPVPEPERAASGVHGSARWMSDAERDERYQVASPPPWIGVPIGEAYLPVPGARFNPDEPETWGMGGQANLLIDPCVHDPHGIIVSGSGGGKTAALTIPSLYVFRGASVTFDPSGQVAPIVERHRREMGHDVVTVGPGLNGFNLLSWIDPRDKLAELHVLEVLDWVCGKVEDKEGGSNKVFVDGAREMEAAILADMLWDPDLPQSKRNLREFAERLAIPEGKMMGVIADIAERTTCKMARHYASRFAKTYAKTFSGVYRHAASDANWLSIDALADMVCRDDFDPERLTKGDLDIFVQIPTAVMDAAPGAARAVIGGILHAVYRAKGQFDGRVLALLDEARFLGKLDVMTEIRDNGRKYGMTMVTMWPSLASITEIWEDSGRDAFFASASWQMFAAITDEVTSDYIAKACDKYGAISYSEGSSANQSLSGGIRGQSRSSGNNWNISEQARDLISPGEVRQLRADTAIILPRSGPPLRCGRAYYFRRPEMADAMGQDPFRYAKEKKMEIESV